MRVSGWNMGLWGALLVATGAGAADGATAVKLTPVQQQAAGLRTDAVRALDSAELARATPSGGIELQGRAIVPSGGVSAVIASVNGQLEELYVGPGQTVRAGAPLGRLYSGELLTLQGDYLSARAQNDVQGARLARDEGLFKDGIVAQSRLLETRAAALAAAAALQEHRQLLVQAGMGSAAIAALTDASHMSPRITLSARAAGTVLDQPPAAGSRVQSGDTLFRLGSGHALALQLQATRADAARLRAGDRVGVEGCAVGGRIQTIGSQLESGSQTVPVRAVLDGTDACLHANQYVRVSATPAGDANAAVSVASSAILRLGSVDHVFVDTGGSYRALPVTVVQAQGERTWVRAKGLQPGAKVVSRGVAALKGQLQGLGVPAAAP